MSLLSRIERRAQKGWLTSLKDPARWLLEALYLGGGTTAAGVDVSEHTALRFSTVWACVNAISQDLSIQPCPAFEKVNEDDREPARMLPAHRLLNRRANPEISGLTLRQVLTGHALTWGNGCAEIQRNGGGEPVALWPIEPWRVTVERKGGVLRYLVRQEDGRTEPIAPENMLHIRGLSSDGLWGYSPIRQHAETLGWAMAQREASARFFGQGSNPSGLLMHEGAGRMTPQQVEDIQKQWQEAYGGVSKTKKTAILHGGLKWQQITIPPNEAQFVETQKLTRAIIAGEIYRIPLHLIGEIDKAATYASVEQFFIAYHKHTLLPWAKIWEAEVQLKLFREEQMETHYVEHNFDALLRADTLTRSQAYKNFIEASILTPGEGRRKENLRRLAGLEKPRGALNIGPIQPDGTVRGPQQGDEEAAPVATPAAAPGVLRPLAEEDDRVARSVRFLVSRLVRKEIAQVRKAVRRFGADHAGLAAWLVEFYRDHSAEAEALLPAVHFERAQIELLAATDPEVVLARWERSRAAELFAIEFEKEVPV